MVYFVYTLNNNFNINVTRNILNMYWPILKYRTVSKTNATSNHTFYGKYNANPPQVNKWILPDDNVSNFLPFRS